MQAKLLAKKEKIKSFFIVVSVVCAATTVLEDKTKKKMKWKNTADV